MPVERVPLGSGYLLLSDADPETLFVALTSGKNAFIPGVHVPIGAIQRFGELLAIVLANKGDYGAGERISLGDGILIPHERGVRLRKRDDSRKNALKGAAINRLGRVAVPINLVFNLER